MPVIIRSDLDLMHQAFLELASKIWNQDQNRFFPTKEEEAVFCVSALDNVRLEAWRSIHIVLKNSQPHGKRGVYIWDDPKITENIIAALYGSAKAFADDMSLEAFCQRLGYQPMQATLWELFWNTRNARFRLKNSL
ncbi:hypothetical protein [Pseudogemmobacter sonorensis]|uniref:hypothetical protein n=1 Tax=Pseudogemmobacter sonorensis TaxID=2989681 RepID=UPI003686331B